MVNSNNPKKANSKSRVREHGPTTKQRQDKGNGGVIILC
jgi:hypothetical protein